MTSTENETRDIWRLAYVSRNEITGSDAEIQAEVEQILSVSRRSNEAVGVRGALLFNRDCFAQALEGARDEVQTTFERIQCDPRHSDVVILGFEAVAAPLFDGWSMGYAGSDERLDGRLRDIGIGAGADLADVSADGLFELMHTHLLESESRGNARRAA